MDNRKGENNYNNYYNQNNYNQNNYQNSNSLNNYNQNRNYNNNQNNYSNYGNYNNSNNSNFNNTSYQNNSYNQSFNNNQSNYSNNNINQSGNNVNNNYNGQYPNYNNNLNYNSNYYNQNNQYTNNNGYNSFNPNYNGYYSNMQNNSYSSGSYESRLNNNQEIVNKGNKNSISILQNMNIRKIILIVFIVVIMIVVVKVVLNLLKSYDVKIYLNGANVVDEEDAKCKSNYLGHCYLTLPNAKRYDGEVLGYSKEMNSKSAEYQVGQKIEVEEDMVLYIVSKKEKKLNIASSTIDDISVSADELTCSTYNSENNCRITVPQFNKRGYENIGYSESKDNQKITVIPGDKYEGNNTLYPVYKSFPNGKTYTTKESFALSDGYVDIETTCEKDIANLFTEYVKTIDKNWPFLLHGQKVVFQGPTAFHNYTNSESSVGGMTYTDKSYPYLSPLFVKCIAPSTKTYDVYLVIVHELAHSFDMQYEYINKKKISFEDDITNIYNKYKKYSTNRPLSNYAFGGTGSYDARIEFFAELMAFYYLNFVDKSYVVIEGENFYRGNYPDDMKKVAEKYICIGMNNFDKSKCS